MKKLVLFIFIVFSFGCSLVSAQKKSGDVVNVSMNLNEVNNDRLEVTVIPPKITEKELKFFIPKTVPGTYSEDNYGRYVEEFKALDKKGKPLEVSKIGDNTWNIKDANNIAKITYLVNDTFDTEKGSGFGKDDIFSPAGTNINATSNFMLNMHGFVGYFQGMVEKPYVVNIAHPKNLWGATSMEDMDKSDTNDVFETARYAELVENPVMYSAPNFTTFNIEGMDILISVYSPSGDVKAKDIEPDMKKMMTAQKKFLGKIDATKKYSVLIYLSNSSETDAKGFGALEHPTCTTVVFPDKLPKEIFTEQLKDVVSHEFFHIVTPLTIHSKEIQYFDFNEPKMSEHLWLYEGVTEYFANLFQVNQGLILEDDFYTRMSEKIDNAKKMNDFMPFTSMSKNVFVEPYKTEYLNVYEKGALIGMCIDIIIREKSDGKTGILSLMGKLSKEYGVSRAFDDSELFGKVTSLTYPEVGEFLTKYVSGSSAIPYDKYFARMGVYKKNETITGGNPLLLNNVPYIFFGNDNDIYVRPTADKNIFYTSLGIKGGDMLVEVNGKKITADGIEEFFTDSQSWKEGDDISLIIKRDNISQKIEGKVKLPSYEKEVYRAKSEKEKLRGSWLKG